MSGSLPQHPYRAIMNRHSATRGASALGLFLVIMGLGPACLAQEPVSAEATIRTVLMNQQDAWNEGDIEGFMEGYWRSDSLRFASGGSVQNGWKQTLDRYHNVYPDKATMGVLTFTLYSVDLISEDHAFVFGRYELNREKDHPTGLFTLLFRHFDDGWKVIFDHTSAAYADAEEE